MTSARLLDGYPRARPFKKLKGLYSVGRDLFVIEVKIEFLGTTVGYQEVVAGTIKQAIQKWKEARAGCLERAKEKHRIVALQRLTGSRIRLFK